VPSIKDLSHSERASLEHCVARKQSSGTVKGYKSHARVLETNSNTKILSHYKVRKFSQNLTGFFPRQVDVCPKSCIAYTGSYKDLEKCPYISSQAKIPYGMARYRGSTSEKQKPRAQVQILPVMATIRALFSNADTSRLMRHRDSCLKEALHLVGTAATSQNIRKYSNYGNSQIHQIQHEILGLFKDPRDVAFALSTDGAQLTMKKHSNIWLLILIILNLPGEIRYKTENVIINLATPGPNSSGDIESFI
jgi:hypothetical protein